MNLKTIDSLIEESESLKALAQAYSEIADLKIQKIRDSVDRNQKFFQEISAVMALIKNLAAQKKVTLVKPKQTVSIILTSNYRFYGKINTDLLSYFMAVTRQFPTDYILVNKAAIEYFRAANIKNYQQVLLKSDLPTFTELFYLSSLVKDYNRVLVFYPSMKSLLVQDPTVADITAPGSSGALINTPGGSLDFKYIFEPDLPKILQFFDSSITTLLLESTFLESELSRTASRFISMDQAEIRANQTIAGYEILRTYAKRNLTNIAVLENYASTVAVKGETDGG